MNLGNGKSLRDAEKLKITMLLSDGMFTLDISKKFCKDHQTIKRTVENIIKLRSRNQGNIEGPTNIFIFIKNS